jgi:hypothetical protein
MWYQCKVNSSLIDIGIIKIKWLNDLIKEDTCKKKDKHLKMWTHIMSYNSLIFNLCKTKGGNKLTQQIVSFESMDETIHSQYFNTCEIVFWKKQKIMNGPILSINILGTKCWKSKPLDM